MAFVTRMGSRVPGIGRGALPRPGPAEAGSGNTAGRAQDYQLWCGPAMGSFNAWARGSFLEAVENRTVVQIALNLLEGGYLLSIKITDDADRVTFDYWDRRVEFRVRQRVADSTGMVFMPATWQVDGHAKG